MCQMRQRSSPSRTHQSESHSKPPTAFTRAKEAGQETTAPHFSTVERIAGRDGKELPTFHLPTRFQGDFSWGKETQLQKPGFTLETQYWAAHSEAQYQTVAPDLYFQAQYQWKHDTEIMLTRQLTTPPPHLQSGYWRMKAGRSLVLKFSAVPAVVRPGTTRKKESYTQGTAHGWSLYGTYIPAERT